MSPLISWVQILKLSAPDTGALSCYLPEHCENISFTVLYIITTTHYSYTHSIYNSEDDDEDMMILLPITCNTNYNIISRKIVNILVFWFKMPLSLSGSCLLPFNQLYSTV